MTLTKTEKNLISPTEQKTLNTQREQITKMNNMTPESFAKGIIIQFKAKGIVIDEIKDGVLYSNGTEIISLEKHGWDTEENRKALQNEIPG